MLQQGDLDLFVRSLREPPEGTPDAEPFWIVGAGVAAAVTGNQREATGLGLVRAAIEHLGATAKDLGAGSLIQAIVNAGVDQWTPDADELSLIRSLVAKRLGGREAAQRWIACRMRFLESNVSDAALLTALNEFAWPLATTNYDNLLAERLGAEPRLYSTLTATEIDAWRRRTGAPRQILHLYGHCSIEAGLLFGEADYDAHARQATFRAAMEIVFRGRPIFIGCDEVLTDAAVGAALQQHFAASQPPRHPPIVLRRRGERVAGALPIREIFYGERYEDLLPFLQAALKALRGGAVQIGTEPAGSDWQRVYFGCVARDFKSLQLPDFRAGGHQVPLALDDVYLALTFDPRSSQERLEESRALHHAQTAIGESVADRLAADPYPRPLRAAAKRNGPVTLAEVLRAHPYAVLLGDPGSGKTTLTQWLARQCALARGNDRADLIAEPRRLDPDASADALPVRIGPAWFPLLVSIPDYAQRRERLGVDMRRRVLQFAAQTVAARLATEGIDVAVDDVRVRLEAEAAAGRLLVMLDGLDENVAYEERRDVVKEIEFLLDGLFLPPQQSDAPLMLGLTPRDGNRVLVTSRLAGYKYAPLSIDVPHYKVEALTPSGVERLLSNLFGALLAVPVDHGGAGANLPALHAKLLAQMRGEGRSGLASLAATPVLASALFAFYLGRNGDLPSDRRGLYDGIVDLFLRREARRLRPHADLDKATEELRRIFRSVAFDAFCSPDSNLIGETAFRDKVLAWSTAEGADHVYNLIIGQQAFGPLVPKMAGAYGFIHRTFQEYLCAECLSEPGQSFEQLVVLASMPSWSEPARLAFMIWLHRAQTAAKREADLDLLRSHSFLGNAFRPLALAIAAAAESADAAAPLLEPLVAAMVGALADALPSWNAVPADVIAALALLRQKQDGAIALEEGFEAMLLGLATAAAGPGSFERAAVAARLLVALDLFNPLLVDALVRAWPHDRETLGWPITSALLRAVTPSVSGKLAPAELAALDASFQHRGERRFTLAEAARYFDAHPQRLAALLADSAWARLLTALLGGQRDYDLENSSRNYGAIASFLQLDEQARSAMLGSLPIAWQNIAVTIRKSSKGSDPDPVYELAVYLDTDGGNAFHNAAAIAPRFLAASCVFPAAAWPALRQRLDASAYSACVGFPVLEAAVRSDEPMALAASDAAQARQLQHRLKDAALRALRTLSADNALALLRGLPEHYQCVFVESFALAGSRLGETDTLRPFGAADIDLSGVSTTAVNAICRELASARVSLYTDDRRYNAAVWLDTHDYGAVPLADICRAHGQTALDRSDLPQLPPPYVRGGATAQVLDDLTALERFPQSLDFFAEVASVATVSAVPEAAAELAAVLARLPAQQSEAARIEAQFGFRPQHDAESLQRFLDQAPLPWRLRARIRLLGGLTDEQRRREELALAQYLPELPPGLLSAQCIELLAERAQYLDTAVLIRQALSVAGLHPVDSLCLRLRLAPLVEAGEPRRQWLHDLLARIVGIADERDRADILRVLNQQSAFAASGRAEIEVLCRSIADPVLRHHAARRPGAVLATLADSYWSGNPGFSAEALAPLIVHAKLEDALPPPADETAAAQAEEQTLLRAAVRATISSPRGRLASYLPRIAAVDSPELADHLAILALAAQEGLGPQTVDGIVAALSSEQDEIRARARAIVLPPAQIKSDGGYGLSAAGCGLETLLRLAQAALHAPRAVALQISWRIENTSLDSAVLAARLCDIADGDGGRADAARKLLQTLKHASPAVRSALAARIPACSPVLRNALWIFFAKFAFTQREKNTDQPRYPALPEELFAPDLPCTPDPVFVLADPLELVQVVLGQTEPRRFTAALELARGHSLTALFRQADADAFARIGKAGASRFSRTFMAEERHQSVVTAAEALLDGEDGPARLAAVLAHLVAQSLADPQPGAFVRSDLIVILAAAAELSPVRVVAALNQPALRALLARMASGANSFPARRAAFLLMGHVLDQPGLHPTPDEVSALLSVIVDVPDVVDAALSAGRRIRNATPRSLARFRETLRGRSAARATLVGNMLIGIARNVETHQDVRAAILRDIGAFIADPGSDRPVYFGSFDATTPAVPTIREQLLEELAASGGGVA